MIEIPSARRESKRRHFAFRFLALGIFAGALGAFGCGDPSEVPPRSDGRKAAGGSNAGTGGAAGSAGSGGRAGLGGSATGGQGGSATGGSGGASTGGSGGSATGGSAGSATGGSGGTTGGSGGTTGGAGGTGGAAGTGAAAGTAGVGGTAGRADAGVDGSGGAAGNIVDGGASDRGDGRTADAPSGDARDAGLADVSVDGAANCGLSNVVTKAYFDAIFPLASRHAVYTYEGFVTAAASYPAFVNTGTLDTCRREAAAFLANVKRETGSLRYAEQIAKDRYCASRSGCTCDATTTDQNKWYFGRGAIQLSWNYNYCSAGAALGVDILSTPSLVATTPELAWKTAIWFWMTSAGAGSATCHDAMTTGGGFGETIRTINGGQECNMGGYGTVSGVTERVDAYIQFAKDLGIASPGQPTDLDC